MRVLATYLVGVMAFFAVAVSGATDADAGLKVTERTKFYSIRGTKAADFARSMTKRGPYSRTHRRRAWATAARDLTFQIERKATGRRCVVTDADVRVKITYTLPKLRRTSRVSKREARTWKRMSNLLVRHEKVHGRYYRELGGRVYKALKRMKSARTCKQLDRNALAIVRALSEKDSERNARFDRRDRRNYRRMTSLYGG